MDRGAKRPRFALSKQGARGWAVCAALGAVVPLCMAVTHAHEASSPVEGGGVPSSPWPHRGTLTADVAFPGGRGMTWIDHSSGRVRVRTVPEDGDATWWHVHVNHRPGCSWVEVEVDPGIRVSPGHGPARSPALAAFRDETGWRNVEGVAAEGGRGRYRAKVCGDAWFARGIPVDADGNEMWTRLLANAPAVTRFVGARSKGGRPMPVLQFGEVAHGSCVVWLLARQHANEVSSTWVARGLAEWLQDRDDMAVALQRRAPVFVVPVVDVDGAASGHDGKNRRPWDHNRDWGDESIWPEVARLRELIVASAEDRPVIAVDIHGATVEAKLPYFVINPSWASDERGAAAQSDFLENIDWLGLAYNRRVERRHYRLHRRYSDRLPEMFQMWAVRTLPAGSVAVSMETPCGTAESTTARHIELGRSLGRMIESFSRDHCGHAEH